MVKTEEEMQMHTSLYVASLAKYLSVYIDGMDGILLIIRKPQLDITQFKKRDKYGRLQCFPALSRKIL